MTRRRIGVAGLVAMALPLAAAVIAPRGAAAQDTAPEFKPGIPGLKMADVRDHKHLWREIEELQGWERTDRISIAEYRSKVIEKTARFLELEGAAAQQFAKVASEAVATIRESFLQSRRATANTGVGDPSATWSSGGAYPSEAATTRATSAGDAQFYSDMNGAVTRVASLLGSGPRHQLFAPDCKKWLLKLAFGPREAKEAQQAQADKSAKPR